MPFVRNGDIEIHYEEEGTSKNPTIVLMHWFMGSIETWYDISWVKSLREHFHLVLVDHRGYGKSSKPHDKKAYHPKNHVEDIRVLLRQLNISKAHFMGYSMGGRIAFAIGALAPDLVESLIIGGMHPFQEIPTNLDERIQLLQQGMKIVLDTYNIGPLSVYKRMMQNDPEALLADTLQTQEWTSFTEYLDNFHFPVLLYVGQNDGFYKGVKKASLLLPQASLVVFPGEDHRTAFVKKRLLLPHLSQFLGVQM